MVGVWIALQDAGEQKTDVFVFGARDQAGLKRREDRLEIRTNKDE